MVRVGTKLKFPRKRIIVHNQAVSYKIRKIKKEYYENKSNLQERRKYI